MSLLPPGDNRAVTFLPWGEQVPTSRGHAAVRDLAAGAQERGLLLPSPHTVTAPGAACAGGGDYMGPCGLLFSLGHSIDFLGTWQVPATLWVFTLIFKDQFPILYGTLEPSPVYSSCWEVYCGGGNMYITSQKAGLIHSSIHPFSNIYWAFIIARQCARKENSHKE